MLRIYYSIKKLLPRCWIIFFRKILVAYQKKRHAAIWPIDPGSAIPPQGWGGWPDGKDFCLVLTHDVDTALGQSRIADLIEKEKDLGFKAAYYVVPERFEIDRTMLRRIRETGFELGVHGLNHDGNLFASSQVFQSRAQKINTYMKEWGVDGYRSPAMHHQYHWMHQLDMSYDSSSSDTDPFEPQPLRGGSLWPCIMADSESGKSYVEIPYTFSQDFTTFVLMTQKDLGIWKKKLDFIVQSGGLALFLTHPDYMSFNGKSNCYEYAVELYLEMLKYIKETYAGQYWHALPGELADYWKTHMRNTIETNSFE